MLRSADQWLNISGDNSDKYTVTVPETTTASILSAAARVVSEPTPNTLTYNASQAQKLVTAGTVTGFLPALNSHLADTAP